MRTHPTRGSGGDQRSTSAWELRLAVTPTSRRVIESLTALSNGRFGTRGLAWRSVGPVRPATVASGVYDSDPVPGLLRGPTWTAVALGLGAEATEEAVLDLSRGVLTSEIVDESARIRAVEFVSIVRPGVHGLRVEGPTEVLSPGPALWEPAARPGVTVTADSRSNELMVTSDRGALAAAADQEVVDHGATRVMTRIVSLAARSSGSDQAELAETTRRQLAEAQDVGFDGLLAEHEQAWKQRWESTTIELAEQPQLEGSLRFAQFHLLSASNEGDEVAIGARGLTGPGYRGHVFWDTDVFVVPALAGMAPAMARAALRYRWHRLGAARQRAAVEHRDGARFPWESAACGAEAAPTEGRSLHGDVVPIRTGQHEEHIVADVAWSVSNYVDWTGDEGFMRDTGVEILVDTARYWQSRVEFDDDGAAHIRCVIGPDEYHEDVDDNAFTNVMARWNLTAAADVCARLGIGQEDEQKTWRHTGDSLVDSFDAGRGIYEQFAGFFDLEPVMAATIGDPPLPADALLGRDRIQQVQIIKQPDVIMLHHMVPDELATGSLAADLEFYMPRTAHGSSLSPAICAAALARAGRPDDALRWFEIAARFDLDNLSGTTAGGLHLATMGGLWQAFTQGFLGIRPTKAGLLIDPNIPHQWGTVTHRFIARSVPVQVVASSDTLVVTTQAPLTVLTIEGESQTGRRIVADRTSQGWEFQ